MVLDMHRVPFLQEASSSDHVEPADQNGSLIYWRFSIIMSSESDLEAEFRDLDNLYAILRDDALAIARDLRDGTYAFRFTAIIIFTITIGFGALFTYLFIVLAPHLVQGFWYYLLGGLQAAWIALGLGVGEFLFRRPYGRMKRKYSKMFDVLERASHA